MDHFKSY